jgi:hypothetical protein
MKFIKTEGCTAYGWSVDGKDLQDLPQEEQNQIFDYLVLKFKEKISENNLLLTDLVEVFHYDDFEFDSERCDQCGDSITTTIWDI